MEQGRFSPSLTESHCQHAAVGHGGQQLRATRHSAPKKRCNVPTCSRSPAGRMTGLSRQLCQPLTSCTWCQWGMCLGKQRCAALRGVASFFVRRAETSGLYYSTCWNAELPIKSSPLRLTAVPSTPYPCTRGHKEDLTSVLSLTHCWHPSAPAPAGDPPPRWRGRWERLSPQSQSSPTLAMLSCLQVVASVCKKADVWGQRCPGLLLAWAPGTVGVNSPLAPSSLWHLPECTPKDGQENLSAEEHSSSKGGSPLQCPIQITGKFSGVRHFPIYM